MAQGQRITDSDLIKLEKHLAEKFESIKGQLGRLQGTIDSLEGHWKGIGAHAFDTKQTEINERMVKIGNLLVWFMDSMNKTRHIKNETEDQVRASVQGIDVDLGGSHSALNSY
ncbi:MULTISPECIES: WXG100 family type VII secretion target [unclassified Streptomyces]|uniref:WXG100 family type VII secretion target n=1 Tax=unclassified Streptomyces TaxID=2593676 RepID=UPI002E2D1DFB|nr:WXG100 family type VII secretion target [Streptomyces sp. NBC_01453]